MELVRKEIVSFIISVLLFFNLVQAPITKQTIVVPVKNLAPVATIAAMPKTPPPPPQPTVPWGTTDKVGDHLYRTYVGNDPVMGTPEEILKALNSYRSDHHVGQLNSDDSLCKLALKRAQDQDKAGTLDSHKGLIEYMNDPNHWKDLNITAIGENASYGYVLSGVHLIEWVFDADAEHKDNQLRPDWNFGCAGTSGSTVDIIFGKR